VNTRPGTPSFTLACTGARWRILGEIGPVLTSGGAEDKNLVFPVSY
jgi:hypothetical protein